MFAAIWMGMEIWILCRLLILMIPLLGMKITELQIQPDPSDIATTAENSRSVFAADMDGDGDMDIISASYTDDTIAWYENGIGYSYTWDVDSGGTPLDGTYRATVAGSDLAGNAYSGTDSIT